jgi:methyl-accepting chemotaxis protein
MSTLQRLLLAFGAIIAIAAGQGILTSINLGTLAEKSTLASTKPVDGVDSARAAWSTYRDAQGFLDNFLQMTRPEDAKAALAKFDDLVKTLDGHLDRLAGATISGTAVQDARAIRANITDWERKARFLLGASPATSIPAPHAMTQQEAAIHKLLDELVRLTLKDAIDIRNDIEASVAMMTRLNSVLIIVGVLAGAGLAVFCGLAVTRPIRKIGEVLLELANGNRAVHIPFTERRDEVGATARAASTFRDNLVRIERMEMEHRQTQVRLAAEKTQADQREAAERQAGALREEASRIAVKQKLANEFETTVGGIIDIVSTASTKLETAAGTLTTTADTTQQLSRMVAAASEQASANVRSVALATDQMSSSITEISRRVHDSTKIASAAVQQAERTDARIAQLSDAAGRIGDVVKLITTIAEQTNLLALNATIEAARAGNAGRGFAVVAHEVKALAAQTANATEEIGAQIAGIQVATADSVTAIKEISDTIAQIAEISCAIAAAVEEQGATIRDISRNVGDAANGTAQVATNITDVNRCVSETGSASGQVLSSAQSLANESNRLKLEVQRFLATVRAA